jgi:putative restriction endonuclease
MSEEVGHPSSSGDLDARVRLAAFSFLRQQQNTFQDAIPRNVLAAGFTFEGHRVPLLNPQGIFKPAILPDIPLSMTTVPIVEGRSRPYEDEFQAGDLVRYRYRGNDPNHRDNVGLRLAMTRRIPLIYFLGVVPGEYLAFWPVFVVGDDPSNLSFTIAVEVEGSEFGSRLESAVSDGDARSREREYTARIIFQRLHQARFRARVLRAYQTRCALCQLRHKELLDAAHILPDRHPKGSPVVSNGLALCKLHHAAFDSHLMGVRPDLVVELRVDILSEGDGPMLLHGLQGFQGATIAIPRTVQLRPNREFLAERYELFKKAV